MVVGALLLLAAAPIMLVIALLIFIKSGSPIIFKQKRAGKDKQPFVMYKFRTMIKGAEKLKNKYRHLNQAPRPMFKIFEDPRFTKLGKWLSQIGLDELPQLINVVKGEMSLVGPRPLPMREAKQTPANWAWRYNVKPGLFSKWTLDSKRHSSQKQWQELERATLTQASCSRDIFLASLALKQIIFKLFTVYLK